MEITDNLFKYVVVTVLPLRSNLGYRLETPRDPMIAAYGLLTSLRNDSAVQLL